MRLSSETTSIEKLPYPVVTYPRGAFPVFRLNEGSTEYRICICMKKAIHNYLKLRNETHPRECQLDLWNFPKSFVQSLEKQVEYKKSGFSILDWEAHITYELDLCHRCQMEKPQVEFCPESEGTVFRQSYGWYLDMKHYEYGVVPRLQRYLTDLESKQLYEVINYTYESLLEDLMFDPLIESFPEEMVLEWLKAHDALWTRGHPRVWDPQYPYNFIQALGKVLDKRKTAVRRFIEDAVRTEFKYMPLVGKWKSEQLLFELVKKLVPKTKIKRNFRSKTLEHLEMDIWLPEYSLGIEYQGIQHYEPVKHWGGYRGLQKVQERDARKKVLAEENNITLVYFHHYEVLSPELVYKRLKPYVENLKWPVKGEQ